jgi:hypothetical protein
VPYGTKGFAHFIINVMTRAKTAYVSGIAPATMAFARVFLPSRMLLIPAAQTTPWNQALKNIVKPKAAAFPAVA